LEVYLPAPQAKSEREPNRLSVAKKRPLPEPGWRMVTLSDPAQETGSLISLKISENDALRGAQRVKTR
jgi:hypothetical protein